MLSYHANRASHFGQCDGGETIDSFRGKRQTTTLRKLPMHAPRAKKKMMKIMCKLARDVTGGERYEPMPRPARDSSRPIQPTSPRDKMARESRGGFEFLQSRRRVA